MPDTHTLTKGDLILDLVRTTSANVCDIKKEVATLTERSIGQDKRIGRIEKATGAVGLAIMVAVLSVVISGCGLFSGLVPPAPAPTPAAPQVDAVARAVKNTVALQTPDGKRFCSGIAAEGTIVTAHHCVDDGAAFEVLYKGQAFPGVVTFELPSRDLAFVAAVSARLKGTVPLATSTPVLGSKVIWTGYPLGEHFIMGLGIVGNPSVELPGLEGDYLAVYGQFMPGNSGGPVFSSKGELIGIISRSMTHRWALLPIGYAIPLHTLTDHLN